MNENIPPCFYRVSVKALILDEQKRFLLIKESNNLWELPGGGLEYGESPESGLPREIKEEMGLVIIAVASQPSYFFTSTNLKQQHIANIVYTVKVKDLNFTPSEECIETRFVTSKEAQELSTYPNIQEFAKIYTPSNHI